MLVGVGVFVAVGSGVLVGVEVGVSVGVSVGVAVTSGITFIVSLSNTNSPYGNTTYASSLYVPAMPV